MARRVSVQDDEHSGRPISMTTPENMERNSIRIIGKQFIRLYRWLALVIKSRQENLVREHSDNVSYYLITALKN